MPLVTCWIKITSINTLTFDESIDTNLSTDFQQKTDSQIPRLTGSFLQHCCILNTLTLPFLFYNDDEQQISTNKSVSPTSILLMIKTVSAVLFMKLVHCTCHAVMPQNMSCYSYSENDAQIQTLTAKNTAGYLSRKSMESL
jgi:hypothetical protein